jgi:hypothetical protein
LLLKTLLLLITSLSLWGENFVDQIKGMASVIDSPRESKDILSEISSPFAISEMQTSSAFPQDGKCPTFDLKNAQMDHFLKISGVDRFTAKTIVRYKTRNGIKDVDSIKDISGVSFRQYSLIKNYFEKIQNCQNMINELEKKKRETLLKKRKRSSKSYRPKKLYLEIIIDNRAKISNKWYSVGDKIDGYTVSKIAFDRVTIKNRYKEKVLKFSQRENKNIEIRVD